MRFYAKVFGGIHWAASLAGVFAGFMIQEKKDMWRLSCAFVLAGTRGIAPVVAIIIPWIKGRKYNIKPNITVFVLACLCLLVVFFVWGIIIKRMMGRKSPWAAERHWQAFKQAIIRAIRYMRGHRNAQSHSPGDYQLYALNHRSDSSISSGYDPSGTARSSMDFDV